MKNRYKSLFLCLLLITTLTMMTCSGGSGSSPAPAPKIGNTHVGAAFVQMPILGATVRIETLKGEVLFEKEKATDQFGIFGFVPPSTLGAYFRVVVTGGEFYNHVKKASAGPFNDMMVSEFWNHSGNEFLWVNPVTTLVYDYMALHPEMNKSDAVARVRKFIGLPSYSICNLHNCIKHEPGFSINAYVQQAVQGNGGSPDMALYKYAKVLASQVDTGKVLTYQLNRSNSLGAGFPFPDPGSLGDITKSLVSTVAGLSDPADLALDGVGFFTSWIASGLIPDPMDQVLSDLAAIENMLTEISQQLAALQQSIDNLQSQFTIYSDMSTVNTDLATLSTYFSQLSTAWSTYNEMLSQVKGGAQLSPSTINDYVTQMNAGINISLTNPVCNVSNLLQISSMMNEMIAPNTLPNNPGIFSPNSTLFNVMLKSYMTLDPFIYPNPNKPQVFTYTTALNSINNIYAQYSALFYQIMVQNYYASTLMSEVMSYCDNIKYPGYFQNPSSQPNNTPQVAADFNLFIPMINQFTANETAEFWRGVETIRTLNLSYWHDTPDATGTGTTLQPSDYRANAYGLALTALGMAPAHVVELQIPFPSIAGYTGSVFQTGVPAYKLNGAFNQGSTVSYAALDLLGGKFTNANLDYFLAPSLTMSLQQNNSNNPPWDMMSAYNLYQTENLQWPVNNYVPHIALVAQIPVGSNATAPTSVAITNSNSISSSFYLSTPFGGSKTYTINQDTTSTPSVPATTVVTLTDPTPWGSWLVYGSKSASNSEAAISGVPSKCGAKWLAWTDLSLTAKFDFDTTPAWTNTLMNPLQSGSTECEFGAFTFINNFIDGRGSYIAAPFVLQERWKNPTQPAIQNGNILMTTVANVTLTVWAGSSGGCSGSVTTMQSFGVSDVISGPVEMSQSFPITCSDIGQHGSTVNFTFTSSMQLM